MPSQFPLSKITSPSLPEQPTVQECDATAASTDILLPGTKNIHFNAATTKLKRRKEHTVLCAFFMYFLQLYATFKSAFTWGAAISSSGTSASAAGTSIDAGIAETALKNPTKAEAEVFPTAILTILLLA